MTAILLKYIAESTPVDNENRHNGTLYDKKILLCTIKSKDYGTLLLQSFKRRKNNVHDIIGISLFIGQYNSIKDKPQVM
jgi:hypothetical protein